MPSPVVPDSPSMNTVAIAMDTPWSERWSGRGDGKARGGNYQPDFRQRLPRCVIRLTCRSRATIHRAFVFPQVAASARVMRVRNSLRSAKVRDKNCRVVRRRGRVYVINKKNPRMKCRQG